MMGVFVIFWRADDVTRTMSKGGVLVNVLTPPSGNPVSAPGTAVTLLPDERSYVRSPYGAQICFPF